METDGYHDYHRHCALFSPFIYLRWQTVVPSLELLTLPLFEHSYAPNDRLTFLHFTFCTDDHKTT